VDVADRRSQVRESNASIARAARESDFVEAVPFICECGDVSCHGLARLAVDGFEILACNPDWYLVGDGHRSRAALMSDAGLVLELPALPLAVS
jgi:hypothetical protein